MLLRNVGGCFRKTGLRRRLRRAGLRLTDRPFRVLWWVRSERPGRRRSRSFGRILLLELDVDARRTMFYNIEVLGRKSGLYVFWLVGTNHADHGIKKIGARACVRDS